jgi:hypothetical protein
MMSNTFWAVKYGQLNGRICGFADSVFNLSKKIRSILFCRAGKNGRK